MVKLIDLFEAFLDYFVNVSVKWSLNAAGDGQWSLVTYHSEPTTKGTAVLDSVATIIHYGLDFVAQLVTLLPAKAGEPYSTY